ncbi:MAG TPA: amidohydrolase [Aeromonadales bacterium]|nr:amidohydrolase [Aeromonadales bacterium]
MFKFPVKLYLIIFSTFLFSLLAACDSKDQPKADSIYLGGTIITLEDSSPSAEAVAVKDGRIIAVGNRSDILNFKGDKTHLINLQGKTLLPGFIDAHGHFSLVGVLAQSANLAAPPEGVSQNINDIIRLMKEHAASPQAKETGWIIGMNYDDSQLASRQHPTARDLDKISSDLPVLIIHQSAHLGVVNSKGLELLGINEHSENPPGGVIRRIAGSQQPNGVLEESILFKVALEVIKPKSVASLFNLIKQAQLQYVKAGFTTVQEGRASANNIKGLVAASAANLLDIDVVAYPGPDFFKSDDAFLKMMKTQPHNYIHHYRIGGMKLSLDGSPQGKTAWLTQPYFKPPAGKPRNYAGYAAMNPQKLSHYMQMAFANKWQLLAHSNGDAATDEYIKVLTATEKQFPDTDIRPVLIHAQIIREDQLDQLKKLKVIPSFMTVHTFYWGDWHRDSVLGQARAERVSPTQSALKRKLRYTAHNDAPVTLPNSIMILSSQVNRITRSGQIIGKDQRVTVMQALKSITINAARQYFEEKAKGSIEVGKLADFVILDKNPLTIPSMDLNSIKIIETIKEGQNIYRKQ